jgi:hypothetical protein
LIGNIGETGYPIRLPDRITPEYVAKYIRFIPPANYNAAAKLSEEIHIAELTAQTETQKNCFRRALALCHT